ncbi:hypothetical protein EFV37_31760 [Mesorhizobium loti]|nr:MULTISPECIES: transposase [Mesorhizobium]ANN60723.1 hypothetical protein A9174_31125 [Mesorhizobium loti NZP2037]OBP78013.1 hypothetical protein BAE39_30725 [Mesorhizobium loti]OBP81267.1 hypothetical protein BAE41_05965 [Mesorhizobium loti]OBP88405.1 hypothetical protein BAE38_14445 [Mesorhizobium loti]OBQ69364.1 hypothetical protein A9K72_14545 [Mesorhizobium loti]
MAGSKEDAETVSAFLCAAAGSAIRCLSCLTGGIIKAIETCFPRSERQRCLAHRMRNLVAKVPEDSWPEFKARATAAYQAPSRAIARDPAAGVVKDYEAELPSAIACFMDDFEACIAHLRMPITHRRAIRTTNLLERLFVEERRRPLLSSYHHTVPGNALVGLHESLSRLFGKRIRDRSDAAPRRP